MARTLHYTLSLFVITAVIPSNADEQSNKKVIEGINNFTLNLYMELNTSNAICSGFSLSTVLNMLLVGARNETAQEIQTALGSDGLRIQQVGDSYHQLLTEQRNNHSGYELDAANSIWIQKGFNVLNEFKDAVIEVFYGEENVVDFASNGATDQINQWTSKMTEGKITKLFDNPLDTSTHLLLANAIYFNGTWMNKFDTKSTVKLPFFFDGRSNNKPVQMMSTFTDFPYADVPDLDAQLLELPYDGQQASLVVILPKTLEGLDSLHKKITISNLQQALDKMKVSKVHVRIPKFSISSDIHLNDILVRLGITSAFDQKTADLSGIDGKRDLHVSKAVQKAMIEVSEEGTVAAAAGGAAAANTWRSKEFYFTANHPFMFLIRQKDSGLLLFMGKFSQT